jgi:hypothetical protein
MTRQIIITPNGDRMVVLPEAEYERLLDLAEDAEDIAATQKSRKGWRPVRKTSFRPNMSTACWMERTGFRSGANFAD